MMTSSTSFGNRASSLPPQDIHKSKYLTLETPHQARSLSTARNFRGYETIQQPFTTPSATPGLAKPLNNDLIKKIRMGVQFKNPKKSDLEERKRAFLMRSRQQTGAPSSSPSRPDSGLKPSSSITYSEASRQRRQAKVSLDRQYSYCPDEDSDHDIITILQHCPPGMRPPLPKPNDPKQMHTWRQVNSTVENYISRLESKKSPKKQRGAEPVTTPPPYLLNQQSPVNAPISPPNETIFNI